jgi:hypothetical protein
MKKVLLLAAAALIAATASAGSAAAQNRSDGPDRATMTVNQIVEEADAHTARIKADLRLTPDQEKNWPGFETALHEIGKNRADRFVAFQAERAQQKEPTDVIDYLSRHAKSFGDRSADIKTLADAAQPLYESLDEQQKRRFARELVGLSRERGVDW